MIWFARKNIFDMDTNLLEELPDDILLQGINPFLDNYSVRNLYMVSRSLSIKKWALYGAIAPTRIKWVKRAANIIVHREDQLDDEIIKIIETSPRVKTLSLRDVSMKIPESVCDLTIFCENEPQIKIPNSVTRLSVETGFFHFKPGFIPESVTELYIGSLVDPTIMAILPKYLKTLNIGWTNNLTNLPQNLENLSLSFSGSILPNSFPNGLKKLAIWNTRAVNLPNEIPDSVIDLTIEVDGRGKINIKLPKNLERLSLKTNSLEGITSDFFPKSLKSLEICSKYAVAIPIGGLSNMTHLSLSGSICAMNFGEKLQPNPELFIPKSVKSVQFGNDFNCHLPPGIFPDSVTKINFGYQFDYSIGGILPHNLEYLELGSSYSRSLKLGRIPPSVRYLKIGHGMYKRRIDIPETLKILDLTACGDFTINYIKYPPSLKAVILSQRMITDYYEGNINIPKDIQVQFE